MVLEEKEGGATLKDWALCYEGGSTTAEICGDASLSEDEKLDDTGTSNEVVGSRFVSVEFPKVVSESVAANDLSS
ncbi:hypothetical protein RIF29_21005 [Crotalaria pallida]|uniref:Uncharacterized protein n=1 Tax=Crotalaria pallida TaxID=3830 RepID=A0AAN9FAQ6_CROPI